MTGTMTALNTLGTSTGVVSTTTTNSFLIQCAARVAEVQGHGSRLQVSVSIQTLAPTESFLPITTMITALIMLEIQTGAVTTTPKNSSPMKCAAHVAEVQSRRRRLKASVSMQTLASTERLLPIALAITALSMLATQTGADTTTPKNSCPMKCAAHVAEETEHPMEATKEMSKRK